MESKKSVIISISVVLALIVGIIAFMGFSGKFAGLAQSFKPDSTTSEYLSENSTTVSAKRPKISFPASAAASAIEVVTKESISDLDKLTGLGLNTLFLKYDSENEENLSALLKATREKGVYSTIFVHKEDFKEFSKKFYLNNNVDSVVLNEYDESNENYTKLIKNDIQTLKSIDLDVFIGLTPALTTKVTENISQLSRDGIIDFVLIDQGDSKLNSFKTSILKWFEAPIKLWINFNVSNIDKATGADIDSMIEIANTCSENQECTLIGFSPLNSIVSANGTNAKLLKEFISKRENYLKDKNFRITNYSNSDITVETSSITFRGTSSPLSELKCNGQVLRVAKNGDFAVDCALNVGKNNINFEHKGKTYTYTVDYKIKLLKSVSPTSTLTVPGNMEIEFKAVALNDANVSLSFNGKTYTMMKVMYEGDDSYYDENSDFSTFKTTVITPGEKKEIQNLGNFTVYAKYNSLSESRKGAVVKVNAAQVITPPSPPVTTTTATNIDTTTATESSSTDTTLSTESTYSTRFSKPTRPTGRTTVTESSVSDSQSGTTSPGVNPLQQYFYTNDYGLGTAKFVEIIDGYVEVYPGNTTSTKSVPDCSPFVKGTVDYFKNTAQFDNETYYFVNSGYKIPMVREDNVASGKEKVTQLKLVDGFVMPKNNIQVVSVSQSNGDTVIKLALNRKVAFNAKLLGQTYGITGDRPVKVSSVDCTGLQFTFFDTESFTGSFNFSGPIVAKGTANKNDDSIELKLEFSKMGAFYGFHYEFDGNGCLVITIKSKPSSLSNYTIMLDAGHGGRDGGASCVVASSTWNEAKLNLSIAEKTKAILEGEGARVIMTRSDNFFLSLTQRNELVRKYSPDLFISIHCDASPSSSSAYGTTSYYYRAYSQPLAKAINEVLANAYKNEIYAGMDRPDYDRGHRFGAYRVARIEECPAVLVEYGFCTNTIECEKLQDSTVRDVLANATVNGIKNYIEIA